MANGIQSSKPPKRFRGNTRSMRIRELGISGLWEDVNNQEKQLGERGRLGQVQANPMANLDLTRKFELLRQAGININSSLRG